MARKLKPWYPMLISVALSPIQQDVAVVHVDEGATRLHVGLAVRDERGRFNLRCAVEAESDATLGCPVWSPDGRRLCVPQFGRSPGLRLVEGDFVQRLTRFDDYDPRWNREGDRIGFYRAGPGTLTRLDVALSGRAAGHEARAA
jgi:hypothetical protein